MTGFVPPEDPPPEVSEHLVRHMHDGRWHDRCRFCLRRREQGGTGVLPEDYLPPVPIGVVHDLLVEVRRVLDPPPGPPEAAVSLIEGEARDDGQPPRGPCRYDGLHCWHWSYSFDPCCHCGSETANDDDHCRGRLT